MYDYLIPILNSLLTFIESGGLGLSYMKDVGWLPKNASSVDQAGKEC